MRWFGKKRNTRVGDRKFWPPESEPGHPRTFYEFDAAFHRRYDAAVAATGAFGDPPLRRMRFFALERAARQVAQVPGNACEVGCFRGLSAYIAAAAFRDMRETMGKKLTFHICDSFEGLSEPTVKDAALGDEPAGRAKAHDYRCSEADVRAHLAQFDFIEFHKGWIPAPVEKIENERFCYTHVDVDLAEPTRDSIEFLWPRLNPGGVMVLDDYGVMSYPGAKRAIDAFFEGRRDVFFISQPAGGGIAVKLG
jgi:O-methyltransferase